MNYNIRLHVFRKALTLLSENQYRCLFGIYLEYYTNNVHIRNILELSTFD